MRKVGYGLACGKYSQKKLAEKVQNETMTEEEKNNQKDEFYQDGIRPQIFKTLIGKGHADFQTGQQQDAREYFLHLLDKITKAEKTIKASDPGTIFDFTLEKRIQCETCKRVAYKTQKENILNLFAPVDSKCEKGTPVELDACLERYFADAIVDDVFCSHCKQSRQFTSRLRFLEYPKTLCMALQRFVFDDWVPKKLEVELQISEQTPVDLEKYRSLNNG